MHQDNLDASRNFESLGNAGLLLFQCLTGDAWSGLMTDAMVASHTGLCSDEAGETRALPPHSAGLERAAAARCVLCLLCLLCVLWC